MKRHEYILECASEECDEISQRISKALRFGLKQVQIDQPLNNAERIMIEVYDLLGVLGMAANEGLLPRINQDAIEAAVERKTEKIEKFMRISRREGCLDDGGPVETTTSEEIERAIVAPSEPMNEIETIVSGLTDLEKQMLSREGGWGSWMAECAEGLVTKGLMRRKAMGFTFTELGDRVTEGLVPKHPEHCYCPQCMVPLED